MFLFQTTVTAGNSGLASDVAAVGGQIAHAVENVNWAQPSWDLFIVLFFVVIVFFYGMMLGRDRIIIILVSVYMALAVVSNAPFIGQLKPDSGGHFLAFRVTAFVGIFVLLFFLLSRSAVMKSFATLGAGNWFQVLLFSILHVGLLVSVTLTLLPPDAVGHLSPMTQTVFASDLGRFLWIVAPIMSIVLIRGSRASAAALVE
jgi:hypothetical protein